ncbi:MAG: phosphodiesterase [Filifactoraceae bacterium]
MKIGFMSDTHGSKYFFDIAMKYLEDCDYIIHTGDVLYHGPRNDLPGGYDPRNLAEELRNMNNIKYVQGNCDSSVDMTVVDIKDINIFETFDFGEIKIFAHHGDRISENEAVEKARNTGAKIIVSGHTHVKRIDIVDEIVYLNPGSTAIPKDGSRSVAKYEDGVLMLIGIEDGSIIKKVDI